MMIRHLYAQGLKKAEIARQVGVSRPTVYRHIARRDVGQTRRARPSKLDPYKDYIRARLDKYDLPATVLLREIRSQGYDGGITILKQFVREIKDRKIALLTERFETLPGQQAQIDWGECGTVTVDGLRRKLYVFILVLGFSRMLFARFTTSTRQPVLLACLREAFAELGVPHELLLDNMKQAVDRHTPDGVQFNRTFLDFCDHHGVLPLAAPPYWARVKGKVERGVGYVKRSFLEGRSFVDLDDLNRQADHWRDSVANVRIHGTTGERPIDRHLREREYLRPLTAVPHYDTRPIEVRKVANDSHIRYRNVFYSVDPDAVGQTVIVQPHGDCIGDVFEVYYGEQLVATHHIVAERLKRITLAEHAAKIRRLCRRGTATRSRTVRFEQITVPEDFEMPQVDVEVRPLDLYESLLGTAS